MLHAKFHDHRTVSSKIFEGFYHIYGHGGHLGHVTCVIYIHFHFAFARRLHIKFGFNWSNGFREKWWSYTYVQLLSKFFLDSDFCHNYLRTPVVLN